MRPNEVIVIEFYADGRTRLRLWQLPDAVTDKVVWLLDTEIGSALTDQLQDSSEGDTDEKAPVPRKAS